MKHSVEIVHPQLSSYKIYVDGQLQQENDCVSSITLELDESPVPYSIWFTPWKIQPMIRIDGFLVDYGVAEIDLFDHMFKIKLDSDFYARYNSNELKFRGASLDLTDEYIYDSLIGVGNRHSEVVTKIKTVLNIE